MDEDEVPFVRNHKKKKCLKRRRTESRDASMRKTSSQEAPPTGTITSTPPPYTKSAEAGSGKQSSSPPPLSSLPVDGAAQAPPLGASGTSGTSTHVREDETSNLAPTYNDSAAAPGFIPSAEKPVVEIDIDHLLPGEVLSTAADAEPTVNSNDC